MLKLILTALLVLASTPTVTPVAAPLPQEFAGWQAVSTVSLVPLSPLLQACHAQQAQRQIYRRGNATLSVTMYAFPDSSFAYSAYSFLRPEPVSPLRPTPHSSIGNGRAMLLVGNLLVEVAGEQLATLNGDLKALAEQLAGHADRTPYPSLWELLPTEGFVPHSDRYILTPELMQQVVPVPATDWAGFSDSAEAELAQYRIGRQTLTLVLIAYPTQQLAALHTASLSRWFRVNPEEVSASSPALYVRRQGPLVAAVFGAHNAASARALLKQISYQVHVTWNEPPWSLTDLTLPEYVVGTIVGIATLLLLTLIAGLVFAAIRLVLKRLWPGRIFDRVSAVEILQLGLTSKPIDARDFY